jgi:hypothetical protein
MENVMTPITYNEGMRGSYGIGVMKCSMKISYLTSVQCMTQVIA